MTNFNTSVFCCVLWTLSGSMWLKSGSVLIGLMGLGVAVMYGTIAYKDRTGK